MSKVFYRVSNILGGEGLWYDMNGIHTGLIHDKFSFCKNNDLPMPFDQDAVGYLSTTDTFDTLLDWFTREDISRLQEHNFYIHLYVSNDWKFNGIHYLMEKNDAKLIDRITL